MGRYSNAIIQYSDGNGTPLPGATLDFFEPGTTTPKDTFSDSGLTTANPNPVVADAAGVMPDIFLDGTYKVVLKDSDGVVQPEGTKDPVGETTGGQFELWLNDNAYNIPDLVVGSDDNYYRSLVDANQGNDPTSSAVQWEQIEFERIFNVNVTYAAGDRSIGSDGFLYTSLTSSNLNNDPTSSAANWGTGVNDSRSDRLLTQSLIAGLVPSNAADVDHDITISTGQCADSGNTKRLVLASAITKQIDAVWAVGDDMGGLFSGTVAADTTYHLFVIEKDSDGSIDAGFDTSLTAANIPSGWTAFRRIASFITDSSSNLLAFNAVESEGGAVRITLDSRIEEVNTTAPGTSAVSLTLSVPIDISLISHITVELSDTGAADMLITEISQTDVAPTTALRDLGTSASSVIANINTVRLTNTSGQIRYRSSVGAGLVRFVIDLDGYTDFRR